MQHITTHSAVSRSPCFHLSPLRRPRSNVKLAPVKVGSFGCPSIGSAEASMDSHRPHVWLVTGASRGLGLEFVRQLLEDESWRGGAHVIAAARAPDRSPALQALAHQHMGSGRLLLMELDVTNAASIKAAYEQLTSERCALVDLLGQTAPATTAPFMWASAFLHTLVIKGLWWGGSNANLRVPCIDVLINNAGVSEDIKRWYDIGEREMEEVLSTNTVGPVCVTATFLPLLRAAGSRKVIANISSSLGSLARMEQTLHKMGVGNGSNTPSTAPTPTATVAGSGAGGGVATVAAATQPSAAHALVGAGWMAYRCSKAALNMVTLTMAADLAPEGFTVVSLHPGQAATDMGTKAADHISQVLQEEGGSAVSQTPLLAVAQSVKGMLEVLHDVTPAQTGTFIGWDKKTLPW